VAKFINGPCLVIGKSNLIDHTPYYYCANKEKISTEYISNVLGGIKDFFVIDVEQKSTFIENITNINHIMNEVEKKGISNINARKVSIEE
jgi:hypothetical protein